jgi:GNAT superfamily N-acetyltransferase
MEERGGRASNPSDFEFRRAREGDARELTRLAVAAKGHWGYSAELMQLWLPDLEFTPESIRAHHVIVALRDGEAMGVVAISGAGATVELEGLWIDPSGLGQGLGRALFTRAVAAARARGAATLVIDSDPHAEGFYRRLGAIRTGSVPSTPAGRRLPRLVFRIDGGAAC